MKKLKYLDELERIIQRPKEPIIMGSHYLTGYYMIPNMLKYPFRIVFCTDCGNYIMSSSIYESNVKLCTCNPVYPKNRGDWRLVIVQNTYENKKKVFDELLIKFSKK